MNQIFHPYWKWECFNNGMWRKESREYEEIELPKIIAFTGCHNSYGSAMIDVINNWKFCIEHHLTDNSINQRAYIGHAACNYKHNWPEYLVRVAWNNLTETQQILANNKATIAINQWNKSYKNLHYAQTEIRF